MTRWAESRVRGRSLVFAARNRGPNSTFFVVHECENARGIEVEHRRGPLKPREKDNMRVCRARDACILMNQDRRQT